MTTCATCGNEQGLGRFCSKCGAPVDDAGATSDQEWRTDTQARPLDSTQRFAPLPAPEPAPGVAPVVPPPGPSRSPREVPRWLPWLLGWLLLAVIAAMIGWTYGTGGPANDTADDPGADTRAGAGGDDASSQSPTPADLPADATDITAAATATAPVTAPPNQDLAGNPVTYDAVQMLDGDPSTAWRMPGDGSGIVLTFTLPQATRLGSVGLVNGYAKVDGEVDWYPRNRRITSVTWGFDDGSTLRQDLIDSPAMQTIGTDGVVTSSVTLTLTSVSAPGESGGRDFTPISDVRLIGSAA